MSYSTTANNNNTDTNEEAAIIVANNNTDDNNDKNENECNIISREEQRRHYRIARYPLGTFWLDSLRLASPWTWAGLATNRKMFNGISIFTTAWQSFLAMILPVAFYKTLFELTSFLHRRKGSTPAVAVAAEGIIANQVATAITKAAALFSSPPDSALSTADSSSTSLEALCSSGVASSFLPSPKQLLLAYLISPWTISWLIRGAGPIVQATMAVASARSMHRRTRALPEAWQVLSDAIEEGRAYRTRKYDAYLPLLTTTTNSSCVASVPALSSTVVSNNDNQHQQPYDSVILLIPGSGLDPTGYAPPAKMLSDCGHVVIVLSSEPLRMAWPSLGFTAAYGKRLIQQVNRELNAKLHLLHRPSSLPPPPPTPNSLGTTPPQDLEPLPPVPKERTFYLMGHSLGAFTASHWVQELNTTKLVLWAALPVFSEYLHDLRSNNSNDDDNDDDALQVLVLQVSNDGIRQVMMETTPEHILAERTKTFWQRLPPGGAHGNVQQRLLLGATHNGFGSHEAGYFLTRPEIQGISRLQQQQQAVALTHEFLVRQ